MEYVSAQTPLPRPYHRPGAARFPAALLHSPGGGPPAAPSITADSAIVIDYDTGAVLYEKDADTMRVPASMTGVSFNGQYYPNTNKLLPGLDYAYDGVDGFKTGTITAAGYCLSATAVKNGRRIISVVMHADDDKTRHTDSAALLDYGFAMLEYQAPYADLAYHWSREEVAGLKELGVELHPDGDCFRPDADVTRAEFAAMLYTALSASGGLPEATLPPEETQPLFADIDGHWAQDYIQQAAALELISGTGANTFSPDRAITRQEMMVLIDRCVDLPDENGLGFADDGELAFWALEAAAVISRVLALAA